MGSNGGFCFRPTAVIISSTRALGKVVLSKRACSRRKYAFPFPLTNWPRTVKVCSQDSIKLRSFGSNLDEVAPRRSKSIAATP